MSTLLYVTSSPFSGSTLLSFLLNQHPAIATVGHTMGWSFKDPDEFRCSCGERIADCPLFRHIAQAYRHNGLNFRPDNFGTAFCISDNTTLNYYLTEALPKVSTSWLELQRDSLVGSIPAYKKRLHHQMLANRVFVEAVLDYWNASCFLDNSHSPYRLRRLAQEESFDVFNLHLIRDPRGVVLSLMRNRGFSIEDATRAWLRRQEQILRICNTAATTLRIHYEDLCICPGRILTDIHNFIGVDKHEFTGNFKDSEHHILGNRMRLSNGAIRLDEKWRRGLNEASRAFVEAQLQKALQRNRHTAMADIIEYYLAEKYRFVGVQ